MFKAAKSKENLGSHLKKVFQTSSPLTETQSNEAPQTNAINKKWPIVIKEQQPFRLNSCASLTPTKNKRKTKKASINKVATIFQHDILRSYLSYKDIVQYLDHIKLRFMDFVTIHTLGTTFERRAIKCIEINWNRACRMRSAPCQRAELNRLDDGCPEAGRNIVFIEGGTHAREWLSVTVALNCIYQLTENNVKHRDLLRKLRFFIVPVVNPDGYEYARNVDRRWRKNRHPHMDGKCIGTDCNRNFDFHWEMGCSNAKRNTYQGHKPFSEYETKALATILNNLAPNLLLFLSLHSYAQSIMYPWGYSKLQPKNAKLMESVAIAGRNAIKAFSGRCYRVGSISHLTKRKIAGSVIDYVYGAVTVPLTLVMELPSNEYGFQPPVDKIHPLGMESWQGIREMCKAAFGLKAKIEEEEIARDDKTKSENNCSVKVMASVLGLAGDSERKEPNKELEVGKPLNSPFQILQNKISKSLVTSMLDVTYKGE